MDELPVAVAAVGRSAPGWAGGVAANLLVVSPDRYPSPEEGFGDLLAATRAPYFLPVQADDTIEASGLSRLVAALDGASPAVVAASGTITADGRRIAAVHLTGPVLPAALPYPLLFRSHTLRAAGGWRPGEACWGAPAGRNRGLLARLLPPGRVIAVRAYLGQVARASPYEPVQGADPLEALLYRQVTVTCRDFRAEGRVAALTPKLLTLAATDGQVILIPRSRVVAVAPVTRPTSWP